MRLVGAAALHITTRHSTNVVMVMADTVNTVEQSSFELMGETFIRKIMD